MLADPPRKIVSAEGVHIVDAGGVRLLDAVAGLWNVNLGYSAKPIKEAIAEQLERHAVLFLLPRHDQPAGRGPRADV